MSHLDKRESITSREWWMLISKSVDIEINIFSFLKFRWKFERLGQIEPEFKVGWEEIPKKCTYTMYYSLTPQSSILFDASYCSYSAPQRGVSSSFQVFKISKLSQIWEKVIITIENFIRENFPLPHAAVLSKGSRRHRIKWAIANIFLRKIRVSKISKWSQIW